MLHVQSSGELNLWQGCHEIAEKGSKIVSLGEPNPPSLSISYQDQFFVFFI